MTLIDEWDAEQLRAYITWCRDVEVVPEVNGHDETAWDVGCGCCSDAVLVPPEFRAAKDTA